MTEAVLTRLGRVKKKSETVRTEGVTAPPREVAIDPAAAAAVLGEVAGTGQTQPNMPSGPPPASASLGMPPDAEPEGEESIYEVMKSHMRQKKEELEARNAQTRQEGVGGAGRPGPRPMGRPGPVMPAAVQAAPVEMVADLGNLAAVWAAARKLFGYLDRTLGYEGRLESLNAETGETMAWMPANLKGFANEKARAKIEESLRAVTGKGIRLSLVFPEVAHDPAGGAKGNDAARFGGPAAPPTPQAQRIPPKVKDDVENNPVVQELMKKLDANVVNIELLNTEE